MITVHALVELTLGETVYQPGERFELPNDTDETDAEITRLARLGLVEIGPRAEEAKGRSSSKK